MITIPGLIGFRIKINKRESVNVFIARKDRYREADAILRKGFRCKAAKYFAARCYQHSGGQPVASVLFRIECMGAGTVAHEMTHAAFHYMTVRKHRKAINPQSEESLARLVGNLVRKFWKRFYQFEESGRIKQL